MKIFLKSALYIIVILGDVVTLLNMIWLVSTWSPWYTGTLKLFSYSSFYYPKQYTYNKGGPRITVVIVLLMLFT